MRRYIALAFAASVIGLGGCDSNQSTGTDGAGASAATDGATNGANATNGTTVAGNGVTNGTTVAGNGVTNGTTVAGNGVTNGTTVAGNGATTGAGGATGAGVTTTSTASGAGGAPVCTADMTTVAIDSTGWEDKTCNSFGVQGAWYCYSDTIEKACPATNPPFVAGSGMCLKGTSGTMSAAGEYGAGIGFSLSDSGTAGGMADVKSTWNATANNVVGFEITISGTTGGLDLRVGYSPYPVPTGDVAPFVVVPGVAGTYMVTIASALVPVAWTTVPNAGKGPDATAIGDLLIQVAGGDKAASYDFCVTSVKPIFSTTSTGSGGCGSPGANTCDNLGVVNVGSFGLQNNVNNAPGGQCVTGSQGTGCVGFTSKDTNFKSNGNGAGAPGSYPSFVDGWHFGKTYGSLTTPKQISAIGSAMTAWNFTVPATGGTGEQWDVSYDMWLSSNGSTAGKSNPDHSDLELMIWLDQRNATPIGGAPMGTVTLAGSTWTIWKGQNGGGWTTLSYIRNPISAAPANFDLKTFFTDAITRGPLANNWYLLSVEAGFEIWNLNGSLTTNSYSLSIN